MLADLLDPRTESHVLRLVDYERARGEPLGCCVLVAVVVLAASGRVPSWPWPWEEWYRLDPAWWRRANCWPSEVRAEGPWVSLLAARDLLGGELLHQGQHPPGLMPGRWHIVQHYSEDWMRGHTYLIHRAPLGSAPYWHGTELRWVQSSVDRGYRDEGRPLSDWPPSGRICGVLVLPESA